MEPHKSNSRLTTNVSNGETTRLIERIIQKVNEKDEKKRPGHLERAIRFTGLDPSVICQLKEDEINIDEIEFKYIDRSIIYNSIVKFYLQYKKMPTTHNMFLSMQGQLPVYMDKRGLREILVKMDYIWKRVNKNRYVIMERPAVTLERYNYLKNITHYREEEMPIIYIAENMYDHNYNYFTMDEALSNTNSSAIPIIYGVSGAKLYGPKIISEINSTSLEEWIQNELLTLLSVPSVIVFSNIPYHCHTIISPPKFTNSKAEIMQWLEFHKVPFDVESSKASLYSLVEQCTDVERNVYKIDWLLKVHGHIPLRTPQCIRKVSLTYLVSEMVKKNLASCNSSGEGINTSKDVHVDIMCIFDCLRRNLKYIRKFDSYIAVEEKRLLNMDIEVDKVLDDLLMKAAQDLNCVDDVDSDVPTLRDSDDE